MHTLTRIFTRLADVPAKIGLFRLAFITAVIVLAVGSLLPANVVQFPTWEDKLVHFGAYTVVGLFAMLSFRSIEYRMLSLTVLTCLGALLEFGQMLVPGRSFDLMDMAANASGAIVAFCGARIYRLVRGPRFA